MKHTVKYWKNRKDFNNGNAIVEGDDFLYQPAMDLMLKLYYGDEMFAVEVFETISGNTVFHTKDI